MKQSLTEQIAQAQAAHDASFARHPRAAFTTHLWFKLRDLKTKQVAAEVKIGRKAA